LRSTAVKLVLLWSVFCRGACAGDQKEPRDEGVYKIYLHGKEIGSEKFAIATTPAAAHSESAIDFRNPLNTRQRIRITTKLDMHDRFVPQGYELKSEVDGKNGGIRAEFSANQAIFTYSGEGGQRKRGVLVGKEFTALDTNIFHHFIFLARLYDREGPPKQQFEVVIPQEADSGTLTIADLGPDGISFGGKRLETRHLQVDSGSLLIHLWVDDTFRLLKISVPKKDIEVVRVP
jgi:hypothetical protein